MSTPERKSSSTADRRSRRTRGPPSYEFSIEELMSDDMGYDADVEIIKPDKYEEAESEFEDAPSPHVTWQNIDEELAARMRHLGREQTPPWRPQPAQGRKRRSVEMEEDDVHLGQPVSPDLEVQELGDDAHIPSPAKRRRNKGDKRTALRNTLPQRPETGVNNNVRDDGSGILSWDTSTSTAPLETGPRNVDDDRHDDKDKGKNEDGENDDDMMDVT